MLSFRLRNVESWDEGLSGVMAFTANGKKHFYLSNADELFSEAKRKKFVTWRNSWGLSVYSSYLYLSQYFRPFPIKGISLGIGRQLVKSGDASLLKGV